MIFLNIIFAVTCYPILLLMYFMFRKAKDRNGWCFGATLSKELRNDPAIEEIDKEYQKILKTSTIILAIIPLFAFFIPYMSIVFSIWMIWICVICFYPMVIFAKANKKVKDLKKQRGWNSSSGVTYTDLKVADVPRRVKIVQFLPILVLNAIPILLSFFLFEEGYLAFQICIISFALCTPMFYLCAAWTDKQKISAISQDSDTNMNYARAKKQLWKNFWLITSWIHTVFTWCMFFAMYFRGRGMSLIIWGTVFYGVVIIGITIWLIKKVNEINNKYESKKTVQNAADDDEHWLYGLVYYNKNDTHVMVENRMSTGTSMNVATGVGKGMYILSALLLLIIPVSCIWLFMIDFTPIKTEIVNDTIVCSQLGVEYEIPLGDIQAYSVVTDLPEMTKVMGTAMDDVYTGRFEIYREGMFEAFLNPQNELFIKILTEEETYYISGVDDKATEDILEAIQSYIY